MPSSLVELVIPGKVSLLSSAYRRTPRLICFKLFKQAVRFAVAFALLNADSSNAARIAMMAMTTNNSIKVNPESFWQFCFTEVIPTVSRYDTKRRHYI